jgi:hypothetical protein
MTIARENTAASLGITIDDSERVDIGLGAVQLKRFWWRTRAYATIIGIMLLTVVSLIFLSIHWYYHTLFSFLSHQVIESDCDK